MVTSRKGAFALALGDIACMYAALVVALFLRYQAVPSSDTLGLHLAPFSIVIAVTLLFFYIAGLYDRRAEVVRSKSASLIIYAEAAVAIAAVLMFYFIPFFAIAPKTNLFMYIALSTLLTIYWRKRTERAARMRKREDAILVGSGREAEELEREVNGNPAYGLAFASFIDIDSAHDIGAEIRRRIDATGARVIVADLNNDRLAPALPELYGLLFANVQLLQMHDVYEDVFRRVPLSLVGHAWFLENISTAPKRMYDAAKRIMDIAIAIAFGIATLPLDIVAAAMIKLEDGGPVLIWQERMGQNGRIIRTRKFRSMERNETDPTKRSENRVTRVGAFLRRSRIDEFPQLLDVIAGHLSLIGPRPELPPAAAFYEKEIPHFNVRHLIKPGLSGWAQLYGEHAHHSTDVAATANKLSYDLYYVKNRSLLLDLKIALQTVRTLLSRAGK